MRKLAVCLAILAVVALTCTAFAQAAKCKDCTKAGMCAATKAAVEKCADCKAKGLCDTHAKAAADCKDCKKDAKCAKCAAPKK